VSINLRPKESIATFTLHSEGTGVAQTARPGGSSHDILVDAPSAFGGHDSAPSPLSYALTSLVSCSQVTAQIVAKELGIRLDAFTFDLSADLDTAVMVGGAHDANPNFERISIEATIRTNATASSSRASKPRPNGAARSSRSSREAVSTSRPTGGPSPQTNRDGADARASRPITTGLVMPRPLCVDGR
jgi:uncharacterized OsmC-like protein